MKYLIMPVGAAFALAVTSAQAQVAPNGDPVLYWNQVAIQQISTAEPDPGVGGRSYAILNIALHDAINATVGSPDHSYVGHVANAGGDTRVAAAYAAHDVLVSLYPTRKAEFDAALAASTAGLNSPTGMATGQSYASATLQLRANDGFTPTIANVVPPGAPGLYSGLAVDSQFGTATPFVLSSDTQFRPGPPPTLDSAAYTAAYDEVRSLGAIDSTSRTADQTAAALFWAPTPETPYLGAAIQQSLATGKSVIENARIFATLTTAVADAPIVAFDAKYTYNFWRPVAAIQRGAEDGNPDTIGDATWQPLLNAPPFPSYFSAHAVVGATAANILDEVYGSNVSFCFTNDVGSRCWANFDQAMTDDADSRLWAGIHFGFDNQLGLGIGERIADFALSQNLFGAVPEPATWAMMILGFGAVGGALRRRTRKVAFVV